MKIHKIQGDITKDIQIIQNQLGDAEATGLQIPERDKLPNSNLRPKWKGLYNSPDRKLCKAPNLVSVLENEKF